MATEAIDSSSLALPPSLRPSLTGAPGDSGSAAPAGGAPQPEPPKAPPIDRVELSQATRELAREVTEREPHLQLSTDRLRTLATGQPDAA